MLIYEISMLHQHDVDLVDDHHADRGDGVHVDDITDDTTPAIPPTEAPIGAETVETREAVTPRNDEIPVEEKRPGCGFDYVGSP